jgi:hypothetical protein
MRLARVAGRPEQTTHHNICSGRADDGKPSQAVRAAAVPSSASARSPGLDQVLDGVEEPPRPVRLRDLDDPRGDLTSGEGTLGLSVP